MTASATTTTSVSLSPLDTYLAACRRQGCRANSDVERLLSSDPAIASRSGFDHIHDLDFSRNIVGLASFHPLLHVIRRCVNLRVLLLPGNGIDNARVASLCDCLEEGQLHGLTCLNLSANPISDAGGKRLLKLLHARNVGVGGNSSSTSSPLMVDVSHTLMNNGLAKRISPSSGLLPTLSAVQSAAAAAKSAIVGGDARAADGQQSGASASDGSRGTMMPPLFAPPSQVATPIVQVKQCLGTLEAVQECSSSSSSSSDASDDDGGGGGGSSGAGEREEDEGSQNGSQDAVSLSSLRQQPRTTSTTTATSKSSPMLAAQPLASSATENSSVASVVQQQQVGINRVGDDDCNSNRVSELQATAPGKWYALEAVWAVAAQDPVWNEETARKHSHGLPCVMACTREETQLLAAVAIEN